MPSRGRDQSSPSLYMIKNHISLVEIWIVSLPYKLHSQHKFSIKDFNSPKQPSLKQQSFLSFSLSLCLLMFLIGKEVIIFLGHQCSLMHTHSKARIDPVFIQLNISAWQQLHSKDLSHLKIKSILPQISANRFGSHIVLGLCMFRWFGSSMLCKSNYLCNIPCLNKT